MDSNPKQQAVERIKSANNILVTVSKNPTVDQLSACIGFTLLLNKLGKHATAVYSGTTPSTIEFLQPEKTLEQNTDSLRDFIIALDKSKADKLRYKVEDEVVRIFITPYKTSISEKDLDFSQGDFNVDVVVALGVTNKEDIDNAIVTHGRILHDAVVISVTKAQSTSDVGSINWHDDTASSLSEMLVSVSESFQSGLLDGQMSTAFLTGIVAETDRFSNEKTSPKVMTMSAQLMAAGANQQLIATKLAPVPEPAQAAPSEPAKPYIPPTEDGHKSEESEQSADGELEINHEEGGLELPSVESEEEPVDENEIHIDDQGNLKLQEELRKAAIEEEERKKREAQLDPPTPAEVADTDKQPDPGASYIAGNSHLVIQPINEEKHDPFAAFRSTQAGLVPKEPLTQPVVVEPVPEISMPDPTPTHSGPVTDSLAQLEQDVHSPHVGAAENALEVPAVEEARQAVTTAGLDSVPRPVASQSLGAQNIDMNTPTVIQPQPVQDGMAGVGDILQQTSVIMPDPNVAPVDPMSPPPVPPPMMPQYYNPNDSHSYLNPQDQTPQSE